MEEEVEVLLGKRVRKEFVGLGGRSLFGTVKSYDPSLGFFEILYEDGDSEELDFTELSQLLLDQPNVPISISDHHKQIHHSASARPKKKRRLLQDSSPGNSHQTLPQTQEIPPQQQVTFLQTLDDEHGNNGHRGLDLNVSPPPPNDDDDLGEHANITQTFQIGHNLKVDSSVKEGEGTRGNGDAVILDFEKGTLASAQDSKANEEPEHGRRRKRRKVSEKLNATTQTVLRRSSRKSSAAALATTLFPTSRNDAALPSAELNASGGNSDGFKEQMEDVPQKLELPPSSKNLNIDDICVLDLFSVYSFLRSFSTVLFLSPFDLEAFVAALNYNFPNSLIDSIHCSVLQTLKSHLEFLSVEGSQSASNCLRSLNWALLDVVTWPLYLVEYLLICGPGLKPSIDLPHLKLLLIDYYNQSPALKIEVLRCLCDDVMESEAIRSELNRRTQVSELDVDVDRTANIDINKKRKDQMDDGGSDCLIQEVADETTDWNSDECCLCKMDGNLICCDGCPAAYHTRCVGTPKDQLPEGEWYCPECLINKHEHGKKYLKSLRGAELLGVDPHGRLFFSCCDYLLVLNSYDPESSYYFYNRNDLKSVIDILKLSNILYDGIVSAISINWNLFVDSIGSQDCQNSPINTMGKDLVLKCEVPPSKTIEVNTWVKPNESLSETNDVDLESIHNFIPTSNPIANNEVIDAISKVVEGCQAPQKTLLDFSNGYVIAPNKDETPDGTNCIGGECSLKPTNCDVKQENASGHTSVVMNSGKGVVQMQCDPGNYVNFYSFARSAASVVQELVRKSPDSGKENSNRPSEEIILAQTKAIFKNSSNFCWLNIHGPHQSQQRESCGWCFSCRNPTESGDCLFNSIHSKDISDNSNSGLVGFRSKRIRKSHLCAITCHILSIEERLSGLLLGPWQNPNYSKSWRKGVLNASDVTMVKHRLLALESNLRRIALSAEWLKQVDTVAVGSASHVMTTSVQVSSSKHSGGRKKTKLSDVDSNSASASARSGIFWWRGGRLSRQLFNCKVLPRSLVSKGGRQAGWRKIPGIFYPEGLGMAKVSNYIAWKAAVESSSSLAHLACQVRELDSNIRWDDIENTQGFSHLSKESKKVMKLFKKVVIRRKCTEGSNVKYLLDFGKRKNIPDTVVRNGVMLEVSASERKKYWLDESLVPLHILKGYEEKKQARVSIKVKPGVLDDSGKITKRLPRKRGLSHLLCKEDKSDYHQCGHCKKEVPIRDAVTCKDCEGFFHKRHVRKSEYTSAAECTYTCHKCQDKKYVKKSVKPKSKKKAVLSQKSKKAVLSQKSKKAVLSQKSKKASIEGRPRRSVKRVNYAPVKIKRHRGTKKGKKAKPKRGQPKPKKGQSKMSKKEICWHKGRRTEVNHAYWLNGLRLTRKLNDVRVSQFAERKLILPHSNPKFMQPTCSLCREADHKLALIYVNCENCQEWFHGEAIGLTLENSSSVLGFRCHKCRKKDPPMCSYLVDSGVNKVPLQEKSIAQNECVKDAHLVEDIPDKNIEHKLSSGEKSQGSFHCHGSIQESKTDDGVSDVFTEGQKIDATSNTVTKKQKEGEEKAHEPCSSREQKEEEEHEEKARESSGSQELKDELPDSTHQGQAETEISDPNVALTLGKCNGKLEKELVYVQDVGKVNEALDVIHTGQKEMADTTSDSNAVTSEDKDMESDRRQ